MKRPQREKAEHQEADKWQYKLVAKWGMKVEYMSKAQAFGIVRRLEAGYSRAEVAAQLGWKEWFPQAPWGFQFRDLEEFGITTEADSPREAQLLLDAFESPDQFNRERLRAIDKCTSQRMLNAVCRDVKLVKGILPDRHYEAMVSAGRRKREELPKFDDTIEE